MATATTTRAKKRYAEDKKASSFLARKLRKIPDNELACRGQRHAWAIDEDFHLYEQYQERKGSKTIHLRRVFGCMRGCGVTVVEIFIQTRYNGIERITRNMVYPPGYQIPGVPRGVKPLHIIQQEQYRRSMEQVAKSVRGDTGAADGDRYARRAG